MAMRLHGHATQVTRMPLKFQYNKTFQQQLSKELRVRENALPTLQAKESALRMEVKKAKQQARDLEAELATRLVELAETHRLWADLPSRLVKVRGIALKDRKIAGVKTPALASVDFAIEDYSMVASPAWLPRGVEILKQLAELRIKCDLAIRTMQTLEYARKKTTQKVNLYEKVQIPEYQEAIRKIKRFLEDEENLAKSSQKILKARLAAVEAA
jgi:V/A-type H+-transporting ATPase subunit D